MNNYQIKARKCLVAGHGQIGLNPDVKQYDSLLEGKLAALLIQAGIKFKPHQKFNVFDRQAVPFTYEVDFLFDEPQSFAGIAGTIDFLEVKGVLSKKDILRKEALEYCHNLNGWIVDNLLIDMWKREGFEKDGTGTSLQKRRDK